MIVIITRGDVLDKYRDRMKEHKLIVILGFRIYVMFNK